MNRRHFSGFLLTSALALAALPVSAEAQPATAPHTPLGMSADKIAEGVQRYYDQTKTFQSSFKQRYEMKFPSKVKESDGKVVFQKPGKMSWRYANGNRVVSDGKLIRIYEKENKQMYEQPMNKSYYPAALSFLIGGGSLSKTFDLKQLDAEKMKFQGGYVLLGQPKEPTPAYQNVLLYIDAKTFQVRRILLLDAQGNRNRFDFVTPSVNVKVPATEFVFQAPPGTQVIRP